MFNLGVDIGSISVKIAAIGDEEDLELFEKIDMESPNFHIVKNDKFSKPILLSEYRYIKGEPIKVTYEFLKELQDYLPKFDGIRVTGVGSQRIGKLLNATLENDFRAVAKGVGTLYPDVKTILEMGGANSKYIRIDVSPSMNMVGIADYQKNGECAAGTGSFIDQQASRLHYDIDEIGDIVMSAGKAATIAGRCSVFAKTDMIHAQQKGAQPPEILKGLCEAVIRNFKGTITKGKKIDPKIVFIGGVAANKGVVQAMKDIFEFDENGDFFVPDEFLHFGAIGAALLESESDEKRKNNSIDELKLHSIEKDFDFPTTKPLSLEKVTLLRNRVKPYSFEGKELPIDTYLGIDVGSVSTNFAVIDENGDVVKEIYTETQSRPIEVVDEGLKEIYSEIGDKIRIRGVGTTGSGRELIGKLVGADIIKDEITAHKTGATFIGQNLINRVPDTIFEIGGQDSKFISIQDGIVIDFTMNEACAAGTGSFLEEQAERMGIQIKGEFAQGALSSESPIMLGERCTVFMERDVTPYLQKGASREDLSAGLSYSIVTNYLNRVVKGRKIGESVFYQGGTAYNDSVAAAFATILDQEIIIPTYNGVIGAIGAALLAQERVNKKDSETTFRGFNLDDIDYKLREFTCKSCSNFCEMQEFTVEGEKTYWGDKCSWKFREHKNKTEKEAIIPALLDLRTEYLMAGYDAEANPSGPKIGVPQAMYFHDKFPFWNKYLSEIGCQIILSGNTNKRIINEGIDASVAEPCFPITIAHGHTKSLLDKDVEFIFIPNIINLATKFMDVKSHLCPWGQTMAFVIGNAPFIRGQEDKIIRPTLHFRFGKEHIKSELRDFANKLGASRRQSDRAVDAAYQAEAEFKETLLKTGQEAMKILKDANEKGIVIVGRPYNMFDSGANLDIPRKLRDYYGVNVIPMDMLPTEDIEIDEINPNMYWYLGFRILQTAKFVSNYPNLDIIYITNFKCGPDSYIKHFVGDALKKPYLTLQFDAHMNDAGVITRCEAYLDSKGFLR